MSINVKLHTYVEQKQKHCQIVPFIEFIKNLEPLKVIEGTEPGFGALGVIKGTEFVFWDQQGSSR